MFLKTDDIFEVDNDFIWIESSWIGGIYVVYLNK